MNTNKRIITLLLNFTIKKFIIYKNIKKKRLYYQSGNVDFRPCGSQQNKHRGPICHQFIFRARTSESI